MTVVVWEAWCVCAEGAWALQGPSFSKGVRCVNKGETM